MVSSPVDYFVETGMLPTSILGIEATTNQAVCHLVPNPDIATNRYVWYALKTKIPELLTKRVGGAQPNISQQIIKKTKIPLPPIAEQRRIVEILDQADALRKKNAPKLTKLLNAYFLSSSSKCLAIQQLILKVGT